MVSLLYFINGSLEMSPTGEQQEKAKIFAALMMFISGVPCLLCIIIRITHKKHPITCGLQK